IIYGDLIPANEIVILKSAETCDVCGCKSKVEEHLYGAGMRADSLICPGEKKHPKLHEELLEKVENSESDMHPKSYLKELAKEIQQLRAKFKSIPTREKA
ncbi:MAG: hypothetical protein HY365_01150, partial [Candidatus Aenigmarchaeota archaeon]|nr:hypothetical protein [Candidatus Aenigmarchaeota archaeon]